MLSDNYYDVLKVYMVLIIIFPFIWILILAFRADYIWIKARDTCLPLDISSARDFAAAGASKDFSVTFPRRSVAISHSLASVLPHCVYTDDVTDEVQAVKLRRDLEIEDRECPTIRRWWWWWWWAPTYGEAYCEHVHTYVHAISRISVPFPRSVRRWRKEGSILEDFLINEGWSPARASFDAPPFIRGGIIPLYCSLVSFSSGLPSSTDSRLRLSERSVLRAEPPSDPSRDSGISIADLAEKHVSNPMH